MRPVAGAPYASHPVPLPFSYPPNTTGESGSDALARRGWPLGWCDRSAQSNLPSCPARLLPHAHSVPSAVSASVCASPTAASMTSCRSRPPAVTLCIFIGSVEALTTGSKASAAGPRSDPGRLGRPSWPSESDPHVYSSPVAVTAAACPEKAATALMFLPARPRTSVGEVRGYTSPCPKRP